MMEYIWYNVEMGTFVKANGAVRMGKSEDVWLEIVLDSGSSVSLIQEGVFHKLRELYEWRQPNQSWFKLMSGNSHMIS